MCENGSDEISLDRFMKYLHRWITAKPRLPHNGKAPRAAAQARRRACYTIQPPPTTMLPS
jgi:hypothetical protein